jgi:hypothetical protein
MTHSWGDALYRVQLTSISPVATGNWKIEIG